MHSTLANNWENHFKDRPSNELSNKTMPALLESFANSKSLDDCLTSALEEQDTVFMAKAPISGHIMFLHHFTKIGGTRTMPTARIFVLIGTEESAFPAQINRESLFDTTTTKFPVWAHLTTLTDPEGVADVTIRANAAEKIIRNCTPLPPFLASALIDQGGHSIPALIITALTSIRAFDEAHKDEENFVKVDLVCQQIVYWLFAAARDKDAINAFPATPSIDPIIKSTSKYLHTDNIQSATTITTPSPTIANSEALAQLATNVCEQTAILEKINVTAEMRRSEKAKGITSLHPSFQKMILSASSTDGTDPALDPSDHCREFYKQKTSIHAQIHLNQTLLAHFKCSVRVPVSLATALYHGNFLWDRADTPNNFCSLLLGKPSPLSPNSSREIMMLHLKASKGAGWSDKDLDQATNQTIIIPSTIDSMLHNLNNYAATAEIFFGDTSLLTIGLQSWLSAIRSDLIIYESLATTNQEFIAQVLTSIDTRVNCWLTECALKPIRCNVDDDLVCFDDMQRSIKTRQFTFALPPTVRSHVTGTPGKSHRPPLVPDRPPKRTPLHNTHKNPRWKLREDEDYKRVFAEKFVNKRPVLDGVHMCPRWHIKGICFTGCNLASTHTQITDPAICRQMDAFCKVCREEAKN